MPRLTTPAERWLFPHPQLWLPMPRFSRRRCCCGGTCTHCIGGGAEQYLIAIRGLAAYSPVNCGDCAALNDDYIVTRTERECCGEKHCFWGYDFPATICLIDHLWMRICDTDACPGNYDVVQVEMRSEHAEIWWEKDLPNDTFPFDCAFSGYNVPISSMAFPFRCKISDSTCTVTAL